MVLKTKIWDYEVLRYKNGKFKKWKKLPKMPTINYDNLGDE